MFPAPHANSALAGSATAAHLREHAAQGTGTEMPSYGKPRRCSRA